MLCREVLVFAARCLCGDSVKEKTVKRKQWQRVFLCGRVVSSQTEETRLWWCVQAGQQELSDQAPALILIYIMMMMMCNSELPLGGYARRIFKVKGWWAYGASLHNLLVYSRLAARSILTCQLHLLTGRQVAASICMLRNTRFRSNSLFLQPQADLFTRICKIEDAWMMLDRVSQPHALA